MISWPIRRNFSAAFYRRRLMPPIPPADALLMIIRTHVLAVGQANTAANYEVLRAIASPKFRQANSNDALTTTFATLSALKLDLSPVVVTTPVLTEPPSITKDGMLRLYGTFPTSPVEVPFGLLFEANAGQWTLHAISVGARPAAKVTDLTVPLVVSPATSHKPPAGARRWS